MGIKGTYVKETTNDDTTEEIFNNRNDEAYYMIDDIRINTKFRNNLNTNEYTNLSILVNIYMNYNERINRSFDNLNTIEVINFNFVIEKNIIINKVWDYCYNIIKTKLRELIEYRLIKNDDTLILDDIYKNSIIFEDV